LADGAHSVPTELRITTNQGGNVLVHLPAVHDVDKPGHVATIPLSFKPGTSTRCATRRPSLRNDSCKTPADGSTA